MQIKEYIEMFTLKINKYSSGGLYKVAEDATRHWQEGYDTVVRDAHIVK